MKNNLDYNQQITRIVRQSEKPLPFVLDANWVNSLGIIRGLAKIGLPSVAINHSDKGVALYSKFAIGLVGPNPWEDPKELVDYLVKIGEQLKSKGIIFITDDKYLEVLAKGRASLAPYYHLSFPEYPILERLLNKQEQYKAAEQVGIRCPRSLLIRDIQDIEGWPADAFPVIVKGTSGKEFFYYYKRQVLEFTNKTDLLNMVREKPDISIILQEKILGGEENLYTCGCYMNPAGEAKAVFTGRKLRQYPRYFGTCTVGESVACPEIIEPSLALLRKMDFYGISQVEYKKDERDGIFRLIEINGRFWKWHSLATDSGVNLAAAAYQDMLALPMNSYDNQSYGLKWVMFPEDLRGVRADIKTGEFKLGRWLRTISPPMTFSLFSLRDPKPWMRMITDSVKKIFHSHRGEE